MCPSKLQHGSDEILPVDAKHPRRPDNEEPLDGGGNSKLPFQLRPAVNIQRRIRTAVGSPWLIALPVKHIVCAYIQQLAVERAAHRRNIGRSVHIHSIDPAVVFFILGCVHCRPSGAVYHGVRFYAHKCSVYRGCIRNVKPTVLARTAAFRRRAGADHAMPA